MYGDEYFIEVRALHGDTVELLCTTGEQHNRNNFAVTRSFVLMVLVAGMSQGGVDPTPLQQALRELGGGAMPPLWDAKFHAEHLGEFIAAAELLERINIIADTRAWLRARAALADEAEAERQYPRHRFVLRARVTDPRWLEGLPADARFTATALEAWNDDPLCQPQTQLDAITARASRWEGPLMKLVSATSFPRKAAGAKSPKKPAARRRCN